MKMLMLALFFNLIAINSLWSQSSKLIPDDLSINVGLYNSNIFYEHNYGGGLNDYLPTFRYSFGLNTSWHLNSKSSWNFGIHYSQQGQRHEDWKVENDPDYYFQRSIHLSYFKLPIFYQKVYSTKEKSVQFLWQLGGYIGVLHRANLTYIRRGESLSFYDAVTEKNDFASEITEPNSHEDLFQKIDVGLILSWGILYELSSKIKLLAVLRSELGVLDINAKDWRYPNPTYGYRPSRNSLLGLNLGIVTSLK